MGSSMLLCIKIFVVIGVFYCIFLIVEKALESPFKYPHYYYNFDVSRKRNIDLNDLVDEFLNAGNFTDIQCHHNNVQDWKAQSERKVENSLLKDLRKRQYLESLDDKHEFVFRLVRKQTRYRQKDYVRTPYTKKVVDTKYGCCYEWIENRYEQLKEIDFACTLRAYESKNQRKLMTPALRTEIMLRDNFTCQNCGKYMPDEVGLQIDHIKPISKGGKTVASNLQVLCSRCNGSKSNQA